MMDVLCTIISMIVITGWVLSYYIDIAHAHKHAAAQGLCSCYTLMATVNPCVM